MGHHLVAFNMELSFFHMSTRKIILYLAGSQSTRASQVRLMAMPPPKLMTSTRRPAKEGICRLWMVVWSPRNLLNIISSIYSKIFQMEMQHLRNDQPGTAIPPVGLLQYASIWKELQRESTSLAGSTWYPSTLAPPFRAVWNKSIATVQCSLQAAVA